MKLILFSEHDLRVDIEAIGRLRHACRPELCVAGPSCCQSYEIAFPARQARRVIDYLDHASRYARHLTGPEGLTDPLSETDDGLACMDTDEDGLCLLAFADDTGRRRCALHAAAVELGHDPAAVKPQPCWLWPLALSEDDPPILTVCAGAEQFPCNRLLKRPARSLDAGLAEIVDGLWSPELARNIDDALAGRPPASMQP